MMATEPGVEDMCERPIIELGPTLSPPAGLDLVCTLVSAETRKLAIVLDEERECKVDVPFLHGELSAP